MRFTSIELLGLFKRPNVILSSVHGNSGGQDLPRQPIRIVEEVRIHKNNLVPDVFLGIMEKTDSESVILKYSASLDALALLEHEYEFYTQQLAKLQGTVVPKCFGLYKGTHNDKWTIGCLILEYCRETPLVLRNPKMDTDLANEDHAEYIRNFMTALCKVYKAGVKLNHTSDEKHSVRQGREPRIIDFSRASFHECPGASPVQYPLSPIPKIMNRHQDGILAYRELTVMDEESYLATAEKSFMKQIKQLTSSSSLAYRRILI